MKIIGLNLIPFTENDCYLHSFTFVDSLLFRNSDDITVIDTTHN